MNMKTFLENRIETLKNTRQLHAQDLIHCQDPLRMDGIYTQVVAAKERLMEVEHILRVYNHMEKTK